MKLKVLQKWWGRYFLDQVSGYQRRAVSSSCTYLSFFLTEHKTRQARSETENGLCRSKTAIISYCNCYHFDSRDATMTTTTTRYTNSVFQRSYSLIYINNIFFLIFNTIRKQWHVQQLLFTISILTFSLTFQSLPVTLRTNRFNIQKFCMLITLHLCVLCGSHNKQYLLYYTSLTDRFL